MAQTWDYLIVGAGVSGLSIGWQLARRGHHVAIVERDTAGAGASTDAAGMLAPIAEIKFAQENLTNLSFQSLELYPDFIKELESDSQISIDYRTHGTLLLGIDRDDAEALDHTYQYQRQLGLQIERLTPEAARELEPGLSPNIHSALFCANDHQIDARLLVKALASAFVRTGGTLIENSEVSEVLCENNQIRGVLTSAGCDISAHQVIIAAGAWTRSIRGLPTGVLPHIRPVKGQMLSIELGEPPLCSHVLRGPDAYLVPRSNGQLLIGSTMEDKGFDARMTAGAVFELLRGAWETLPGIYDSAILETWSGFRPVSLDGAPILGPSPVIKNLWFALGYGRHGILLTPITAKLMTHALETQEIPAQMKPFLIDRFQRR